MSNTKIPAEKIYFLGEVEDTLRERFSSFTEARGIVDSTILLANDWRAVSIADRGSLADKKVICYLPTEPFGAFHDPAFRDVRLLVGLWLATTTHSRRLAETLRLPVYDLAEGYDQLLAKLLVTPESPLVPRRQFLKRAPEPEGSVGKGLRALGLKPKRHEGLTVSMLREFVKPPYGGGNQFMLALKDAFEKNGVRVLVNVVADHVHGYFFDSLWFDEKLIRKLETQKDAVVIHRVDGPIHLYRGKDKELDDRIFELNARLATSTVIQSDFTLEKVLDTGYKPVRPVVIRNAANPEIFFPRGPKAPVEGRKVRIIASSWSDNPNKGGPVYKWLEEHLDWSRYEFTFVGRCSEKLLKARMVEPVPSEKLAALLNEHDVYVTASQNDPCSNALIEAQTCGLPAIALRSGGHPELVGEGGLCFDHAEELPALLARITGNYEAFRNKVSPPRMQAVSELYLSLVKEP